ncbi:MAG: S9 family peptidase, partial [Pseudomonadota bacterium]
MRFILAFSLSLALAACATQEDPMLDTPAATAPFDPDAHLYLEEVEGEEALAWVRAQNERSLARLESDPRFEGLKADALKIANAKERIPYGSIRNGYVYNFWQDETNVRGLWRRTPL